MRQEAQLDRVMRATQLKKLFDDVFFAAVHSGLLVDKAIIKASEAVEHVDAIEGARNRVVMAQLTKEFGDDAQ